jgi:GT2 family glycosyltransferase
VNFWDYFLRLLPRRPVPAVAALYWHLTKRKVRARNRLRVASADLPFAYALWIEKKEKIAEHECEFRAAVEKWTWRPRFSVLLHAPGAYTAEQLERSAKSLERQIYPFWCRSGPAQEPIHEDIAAAEGDYVVPLRIGDALSPAALFHFAEALQADRHATILYGDHDHLDARGRRRRPWFKPLWNEEMFLAQDYLSPAVAIESCLAKKIDQDRSIDVGSLVLAATSTAAGPIVHVPAILCHVDPTNEDGAQSARLDALRSHLQLRGASCAPGPFGTAKVQWPLPRDLPLVSIIIPTKDKVHLLRSCVESVTRLTDYKNYEILIVDNGSVQKQTADYLAGLEQDSRIRTIPYPGPYNFSAINNFAVRRANGSHLCLLNNDTEVVEPGWLTELMRYAVRPDVGAVGAKLLYEDRSIQHAGIVIGIGEAAGHAHRFLPADQPGYFRTPHVAQFISAVTAACLVVDRRKFLAVGGLDEESLAVAFNDVDFCLKLEAAGWRNVYVPHAVLFHHESRSRGLDSSPTNIGRFRRELKILQDRWGTKGYQDRLFNPNLDPCSETFVLRV